MKFKIQHYGVDKKPFRVLKWVDGWFGRGKWEVVQEYHRGYMFDMSFESKEEAQQHIDKMFKDKADAKIGWEDCECTY